MEQSSHSPTLLASMDWPWKAENHAGAIILVSDEQFVRLASFPDEALEKPAPWVDQPVSLRQYCRELAENGGTKIHIAYDYFFGGSERGLYPDTPEFQENLKKMHDVAREYGLGIEPSVLSPLEYGVGYQARTGESGRWMQYAEGMRDPLTGRYSVEAWKHIQWVNNKGPTPVKFTGARAFAFAEKPVPGTFFFEVDPEGIVELPAPQIEEYPGTNPVIYGAPEVAENPGRQFQAHRVRLYGEDPLPTNAQGGVLNRVFVVLLYDSVEMDYFSPAAAQFVHDLVHQIHDRGIELEGVYSDEMHIQQDWVYHHHLDLGQFTMRYVSPGLERAFAAQYGGQYADFARWLVYFTCHQHTFLATHEPKLPSQHVFGPTPEAIAATLLFRRNYYHFLEESVVKLMISGREELERLQGRAMDAFYHATWAESPTCDLWSVGGVQSDWTPAEHRLKYEYTPEFVWSNTVQQAAAACANYFAWNKFLTGGNNDVPEGGYSDRDYYGRALACSLAALNRQPLASCGMWGMPGPVADRMAAVSAVFGAGGHAIFRSVGDYAPRKVEVLFLYPQDLVAVEERFGSWMVQYGYANLITADVLTESAQVLPGGWLEVNGSRYTTLCAMYEPFPSTELLDLMKRFVESGGKVVWSGVPPLLRLDGQPVQAAFLEDLFGVQLEDSAAARGPAGMALPGRQVVFSGALQSVAPMPILTDFLVDRVFAARVVSPDSQPAASIRAGGAAQTRCIGAIKRYPGGGQALYLGFRPRDDQSASTGQDIRAWFEILSALGAYPGGAANPAEISRHSAYVAAAFPNDAYAIAPHYNQHEESWPGGFFRSPEQDAAAMQSNPVASDAITLEGLRIGGQVVTFSGKHCLAWRRGPGGELLAFAGLDCTGIELDGRRFQWADQPADVAWHPLPAGQETPGFRPLYRIWVGSAGSLRMPLALAEKDGLELWLGGHMPTGRRSRRDPGKRTPVGYGERQVAFRVENGDLIVEVDEDLREHWFYLVQRK